MTDRDYMLMAIEKAAEGIENAQTPFGACIVSGDEILSVEHNNVWNETDITAHAEVCAIRSACRKTGGVKLENAIIYSTTEPCPMCFSAIHWAGIKKIFYGTNIADAADAGFNELQISNITLAELAQSEVEITADFCRKEALELFEKFKNMNKPGLY